MNRPSFYASLSYRRLFPAIVTLGLVVGCAARDGSPRTPPNAVAFQTTVQQRASFDLSCPSEQLAVQPIGGNSYGATGCGQKVSYSCICAWSSWGKCTQPVCSLDGEAKAKGAPRRSE
jgi:hypothetical protein